MKNFCIKYEDSKLCTEDFFNHCTVLRLATDDEIVWLNDCIEAGRYVDKNEPKTYKFNKGDLIVVTLFEGVTTWKNHWFEPGKILKLGGEMWEDMYIERINEFIEFAAISKQCPKGRCMVNQKNFKFRHATQEEIDYYNKVGLGANINDMNQKDSSSKCPYKVGDVVTIKSKPTRFTSLGGGTDGKNKVIYPYTFIIQKIQSDHYHTALIDGQNYGWVWKDAYKDDFILNTQKVETPHTLSSNIDEKIYPCKIGDKITILKRPLYWTHEAGGCDGLDKVIYPYTFTVKKIVDSDNTWFAIFDGQYGWCWDKKGNNPMVLTKNISKKEVSLREIISNQVKEESSKEEESIFKIKSIRKIKV